jgi:AAA+ superfamily predicted ATPase
MNDSYPGKYYEKQLTRAPKPNFKRDFFSVEKIVSQKTIKKKKFFLVKFLFYPSKFNQYISENNMKFGSNNE